MKIFSKKIFYILNYKFQLVFKKIIFLNSLNFLFEIVSLFILPLFVSALVDIDFTKNKISNFFSLNNINNFDDTVIIKFLGILVVLIFVLKNFYLFFLIKYQAKFFYRMKKGLSEEIFLKYISLPYEKFITENSSKLVRNMTSEIQSISGYLNNLMLLFREILAVIVIFIVLLLVNYKFTIYLCFILLFFTSIYQILIKPYIKKAAKKNQHINSNLIKILSETFGSFKEIKIASKENEVTELYLKNLNQFEQNLKKFYIFDKIPKIFLELLILVLLVVVSFLMFLDENNVNFLPQIAILLILSLRFLPAFNGINISLTYLKIFRPSLELIYEKKQEFNSSLKENSNDISTTDQSIKEEEDTNFINMKNISYKYPEQDNNILRNINIKINKGEKIGISGRTGCGKSTLLYLMMGLIKPSEGKIFIQGKELSNWQKNFKLKISYVPQVPFLFDTSIKKNIAFDFSEEENENELESKKIEEIIKITMLQEKINTLPQGIITKVGDNAIKLSGGEKQRISIARALYKNFDLLFLDEFTSSLDSKTEEKIIGNILKKFSNKTFIIISHKSSTLKMCDKIINLDNDNGN